MPAAFVQSQHGSSTASGATIAATYGVNVTAGNYLVIAVLYDISVTSTAAVSGVADTLLNAYTQIGTRRTNAVGIAVELWRAPSPSGGANTVTVTISAAVPVRIVAIHESSTIAASPDDGQNGGSGSVASATTGTITPTLNGDLFIAITGWDDGSGSTFAATNGFTKREDVAAGGGTWHIATETLVQSALSGIAATGTLSPAINWVAEGVALMAADGTKPSEPQRTPLSHQQRRAA